MNILVATDFSTRSFRALRQAGFLGKAGGKLHVLHVADDDQPADLVCIEKREAERVLREQIASIPELDGVDARALVVEGDPFDAILRTARDVAADLIVMGAHRRQLLDIFTGTTIERVIRKSTVPVLMVNNEAQRAYKKIVAPVDMSQASANALREGLSTGLISKESSTTLVHAFTAWARGKMYIAGADAAAIAKYVDDEKQNASKELSAFLAAHNLDKQGWAVRIEQGEAIEVISQVASDLGADLLIMGTHGRSGLLKTLIGSVTEQALRSLPVDILAVPRREGR